MVVVKNVNTRFGMSRTTGTALIYGSAESKSIEPEYVIERHSSRANSATKENAPSEEEGSNQKSLRTNQKSPRKVMLDGWIRREVEEIQAIKIRNRGRRTGQEGNSLPPTWMRCWGFSR